MTASETLWSNWAWPAATALLGLVFAGLVLAQWLSRRKTHQLLWSIGLLMYAVAAVMEAVSEGTGHWDALVYRFYIVLAASLVGFLGAGSFYLLSRKNFWPRVYLGFTIACVIIFLAGTLTARLDTASLVPGITVGGRALGSSLSFPRVMSLAFNIPGTIFLLGGAVVSVWRFARKREYAYRMWANVLIAGGTAVIAATGARARAGVTLGLYPAEMVASALLLAGFLLAGTLDKGARQAAASRAAVSKEPASDEPGSGETSDSYSA